MGYLGLGLLLGLAAGVSPGPLLALLVRETLQGGKRSGLAVAVVPVFTDLPVIMLLAWALAFLRPAFLGLLSAAGGLVLLGIAYRGLFPRRSASERPLAERRGGSFRRGLLVNAFNPHMYIFWGFVGLPVVLRAGRHSLWAAAGFVAAFLVALVGLKVTLVLGMERARRFLRSRGYARLLAGVHLALGGLGLYLLYSGLTVLEGR
ncbi:MAG: LysE family transporter [Thermaerobacter sp.]|jgi:threonine/homoserine/homoserine lactone efflux protein|nr:LysE family transporter [Thermaerobacter sp.]